MESTEFTVICTEERMSVEGSFGIAVSVATWQGAYHCPPIVRPLLKLWLKSATAELSVCAYGSDCP